MKSVTVLRLFANIFCGRIVIINYMIINIFKIIILTSKSHAVIRVYETSAVVVRG